MTPKWIYYAATNFGVVVMTLLTPLLGPRLPTALGVVLLIVCLIAANLAAWYITRARARLALATDQAGADRSKMGPRMIQLGLIVTGLLLLAMSMMFSSLDKADRIFGMITALTLMGSGIVFRIKRKPSA